MKRHKDKFVSICVPQPNTRTEMAVLWVFMVTALIATGAGAMYLILSLTRTCPI